MILSSFLALKNYFLAFYYRFRIKIITLLFKILNLMKFRKIVNIAFFLIVSWQISFASSVPASQFVKEADLYKQNNEYVNAFQFYIKGLIAALETDDYRMAMKCYGNLSIIYHDFGDIDNSFFLLIRGMTSPPGMDIMNR